MPKNSESYKLTSVDYTEEGILNEEYPNPEEPIRGWRRFRVNYRNDFGFSNVEGTLYFPPDIDPYPILDSLCKKLQKQERSDND